MRRTGALWSTQKKEQHLKQKQRFYYLDAIMFSTYLQLGFQHITDLNGYDHMLFITAMVLPYNFKQIKQILVLVTGFTLGHSLSLVAAYFNWFTYNSAAIELGISVSILISALLALYTVIKRESLPVTNFMYGLVTLFGIIHGFGFSGYLSSLLGSESGLIIPLFGFNVGLELGQLLVIAIIFSLLTAIKQLQTRYLKHSKIAILAFVSIVSIQLIYDKISQLV